MIQRTIVCTGHYRVHKYKGDAIMNKSFEVKIHPMPKCDTVTDPCERYRYKAQWVGRQYIADNIICHVSAVRPGDDACYGSSWVEFESRAPYEDSFVCRSHTLDGCISEAEYVLKDCLFGKAELLDGKYRVATVTKRYDDECTNSGLTRYGEKCKKSEPEDQSVLMSLDAFDAYYDEY